MTLTSAPPSLPGHIWRPFQAADVTALLQLEQACAPLDGATHLRPAAAWQEVIQDADFSQVAVNAQGQVAAVGWLELDDRIDSVHAFHFGRVHPDFRGQGIGTALLTWLEATAVPRLQEIAPDRPRFLRTYFYDRAQDAIDLLTQFGYQRQYAEDEMRFDLCQPLPDATFPPGTAVHSWAPTNADTFYAAYRAAFTTRTDTLMDAPAWRHHFANPDDDEFQPQLSLLAMQENVPIAYAVIHVETAEPDAAWIAQMGVHHTYRRQGLGTALLLETARRLANAGYREAVLSVNLNNPGARALYQQLGFRLSKRLSVYYKPV
jgi:ribosomal protein S18 acetylase RimI-like enzyme